MADLNAMMENCRRGDHDFEELSRVQVSFAVIKVERWCHICGATKKDRDVEGESGSGNLSPIRLPKITQLILASK